MFSQKPEFIAASDTIDLRHRILRPHLDISSCHYPNDSLSSTFHVGIRDVKGKIISNGTFISEQNILFPSAKKPYRLRGMATDFEWQKKGCGRQIILSALEKLREIQCDLLWFNARTSAELFYSRLGFSADENIFDIPSIGAHKVMYKRP